MANFNYLQNATWDVITEELFVNNDNISEIETNGTVKGEDAPVSLFYREKGVRKEIPAVWANNEQYNSHIYELHDLFAKGDEIPDFVDGGRLILSNNNTARVHIMLPPASENAQVTIAKKSESLTTLDDLKASGTYNQKMLNFIRAALACKFTIAISGSTGAGKTTLLEAMAKEFDNNDRIGVVEETPELKLANPNTTYLHSTLWRPGLDVNDVATLEWCVQQVNEQRVDRIIIGETRGKEFADFITAANSGMEGSMTTIHANNPAMCLQKMTNFMITGLPQPVRSANQSISQTIDFIIQVGNSSKHGHKVTQIEAVSDTLGNDESANIASSTIFKYDEKTNTWAFQPYFNDRITEKLRSAGYDNRSFERENNVNSSQHGGLGSLKLNIN